MAYFFKLPLITDLTKDQQLVLKEIDAISISGGAGTGKTVVSLWRHLQTMETLNKFSVLVTFTKTLGFYLQNCLNAIENKEKFQKEHNAPPSNQVFILKDFPFDQNWKVSEIIIDEAQDLKLETIKKIANYGEKVSYGADFNQQLYSDSVKNIGELECIFPNNIHYDLQRNFRNSYYILRFVKGMLPKFHIDQNSLDMLKNGDPPNGIEPNIGIKPIYFITSSTADEIDKIIELINNFKSNTHNIAVLLPFGNSGSESVESYHALLQNKGIECSKYYNAMKTDNIEISNIHVTTYKSSKGLEFDTVIIPHIDKYQDFISRSISTKINDKDYYVALTRAKRNLYLFGNKNIDFIPQGVCDVKDEVPF